MGTAALEFSPHPPVPQTEKMEMAGLGSMTPSCSTVLHPYSGASMPTSADVALPVNLPNEDQPILAAMEMLNGRCVTECLWAEASPRPLQISLGRAGVEKPHPGHAGPGVDVVCSPFPPQFPSHTTKRHSTNGADAHSVKGPTAPLRGDAQAFTGLAFVLPV